MSRRCQKNAPPLTWPVLQILQEWSWPGNLRELENGVARVVLLSDLEALASDLRGKLARKQAVDTQHLGLSIVRSASEVAVRTEPASTTPHKRGEWLQSRADAMKSRISKRRRLLRNAGRPRRPFT